MGQPGFGGALDTPRTNMGDATYLSQQPDFADISQEASFQSPGKDGNFLQQLRNGRSNGVTLRTPRQRGPLADRRNLPPSVGGAEFTPLLKSATRNGVRKNGKENGAMIPNTPALDRIDEDDLTPVPRMDASIYSSSRNQSYLENTLPQIDSSSVASTPLVMQARRGGDRGPLQDGNQLSLKEQENVIDRIEKENFGLKLKIHFLEDALRKAGPGFSEAALKENTELKVDKVTMQRELHRYKKQVSSAEKDLESYRQQMLELQERSKRKQMDETQRLELEQLRKSLEEREADVDGLQRQLDQSQNDEDQLEKLRDSIEDLEADLREKDRQITERDDELDDLREKLDAAEDQVKESRRKAAELEDEEQQGEELEEAKETIEDLELNIRRLEQQVDEMKESVDEAKSQRERAESDLEELQEEMSNKSVLTKGLSRQIEEKVTRLQEELDKSGEEYAVLEKELASANEENDTLRAEVDELRNEQNEIHQGQQSESRRVQELEAELLAVADEKDLLQSRHDALSTESKGLEQSIEKLEIEVEELQGNLAEEKEYAFQLEKDLRAQYQDELERLNDEISNLQAEVRERDNLYDNDSEKWENEKQTLVSQRERAEEKAAGLQRTIDRIREAEGALSSKESKLQQAIDSETERHKSEEAVMARQVDDLQDALDTRQTLLTSMRSELSAIRDELRQTQIGYETQVNKVVALEDEVELLRTKSTSTPKTSQHDSPTKSTQLLRDQVAKLTKELSSTEKSLTEAKAQLDELNVAHRRHGAHDDDPLKLDQNRLDLRAAKMKLDNEVRRLKSENKSLDERLTASEDALEAAIEKAAAEQEKLRRDLLQAQTGTTAALSSPSLSRSPGMTAARETIKNLESRIEGYKNQLASMQSAHGDEGDNTGEISMIRKDLTASRQKELEFLQRESAHRDLVKNLNRQIADLDRQVHDGKVSRLMQSPRASPAKPAVSGGSDIALQRQLSEAQQSLADLALEKADIEQQASEMIQDLQRQLSDLEDQKVVLEEVLEEARQQAEETAADYEKSMRHMKHKLDKAERDRDAVMSTQTENNKQGRHLRKSQAEVENLEHDIRQQQELMDSLAASEAALRRKLERARSERSAYRMSAEKLQRDIHHLQAAAGSPFGYADRYALTRRHGNPTADNEALETVVRAAEGAEDRHKKELKGMVMQMEWMQARWEREAVLRSDVAYAKKFIQLQLDVANAWFVHTFTFARPLCSHIRHQPLHTSLLTYEFTSTATKRSYANWSISEPTFFTARNRSLYPPHLAASLSARRNQRLYGRSSPWLASSLACVYLRVIGLSRRM